MDDNKKQLDKELTEIQCPECHRVSFYGYWILNNDGNYHYVKCLKCPKCGAIIDED